MGNINLAKGDLKKPFVDPEPPVRNSEAAQASSLGLDGPTIFCALLWLAASVVLISVVFRKIRLYVDAYRRRKYMEKYRHLCQQQYNQRYNQQYWQQGNEKSGEIHGMILRGRPSGESGQTYEDNQKVTSSRTQQDNHSDKSSDFLGLYNDLTGKEKYIYDHTERDIREELKSQRDSQADMQIDRLENMRSGNEKGTQQYNDYDNMQYRSQQQLLLQQRQQQLTAHQQQKLQQQLEWEQHERDLMLLQGDEDLLLGGPFYSNMSMPRFMMEDADLL